MDYDRTDIPAGYDRGRDHGPEFIDLWMNTVESHLNGRRITRLLDLGCGTGRFCGGLAGRLGADVIGVDPSANMLAQARAKCPGARLYYVRGQAEAIPLPAGSVGAVFMSMSFHHFNHPSKAARECRRVLSRGGHVLLRTGTREQIEAYPYVPFFPASRPILAEVLPDHAELRAVFEAARFRLVTATVIKQTIAPGWAAYADKLAAGGDSVLSRLSRPEIDAGLAALRAHATKDSNRPIVEPIDFLVFR